MQVFYSKKGLDGVALELACGNCYVSRQLLSKYFSRIEFLDQAQNARLEVEKFQKDFPGVATKFYH